MNELTIVSSVLAFIPAAYIFHKFYHLNKGINQYTQQVKSLSDEPAPEQVQPNLTLIHCKKSDFEESGIETPKVVSLH